MADFEGSLNVFLLLLITAVLPRNRLDLNCVPDMIDWEDRGGDEPWDAEEWVDNDADGHDQQVQVVAATFLNIFMRGC